MGYAGYVHNTYHNYGKLGPKANKCIFIRYYEESKGHVMLGEHPNGGVAEIELRDVNFIDNDFPSRCEVDKSLELYEMVESLDGTSSLDFEVNGNNIPPSRCFEIEGESFMIVAKDDFEPKDFIEAMSSPACNEWMEAMKDEMESMRTNQVWKLIDLPPTGKSNGKKWVLKIKHKTDGYIEKYKGRLVAKGYTQRKSVDFEDTFSLVVRWPLFSSF